MNVVLVSFSHWNFWISKLQTPVSSGSSAMSTPPHWSCNLMAPWSRKKNWCWLHCNVNPPVLRIKQANTVEPCAIQNKTHFTKEGLIFVKACLLRAARTQSHRYEGYGHSAAANALKFLMLCFWVLSLGSALVLALKEKTCRLVDLYLLNLSF